MRRFLRLLDQSLFDSLLEKASELDRKRCALNLHTSFEEHVQRVVIAMHSSSYVRPHLHQAPQPFELFIVLKGEVDVLLFDDMGHLLARHALVAGSSTCGIEISQGQYHSLVAKMSGVVFLEVKQGPFHIDAPRYYAEWAPSEGDAMAQFYLEWLSCAEVGQRFDVNLGKCLS